GWRALLDLRFQRARAAERVVGVGNDLREDLGQRRRGKHSRLRRRCWVGGTRGRAAAATAGGDEKSDSENGDMPVCQNPGSITGSWRANQSDTGSETAA